MYYEPDRDVGPYFHDHVKALVAPRPIGWISSLSPTGIANLAPYSFFNILATGPTIVGFGSCLRKDSQANVEESGEFVCNIPTYDLREAVNGSSVQVGRDQDEFDLLGLEKAPSVRIKPPRVAAAPAHLECVYLGSVPLYTVAGDRHEFTLILGQVVAIHIDDRFIRDGRVDAESMRHLSRLGYFDFTAVRDVFEVAWPEGYNGGIMSVVPIEESA